MLRKPVETRRDRMGNHLGEARGYLTPSLQYLGLGVGPCQGTSCAKEQLCIQQHVEADLREHVLKVRRANALSHVMYSTCFKHFVDPDLDRGVEWLARYLRVEECTESGKDSRGTHVTIDVLAEGSATHFALFVVHFIGH